MTAADRTMKPKEPIPAFKSRREEAEFWDTHDLADYRDEWSPVDVQFADTLSAGISIHLDSEAMQRVQDEAKARGVEAGVLVAQ